MTVGFVKPVGVGLLLTGLGLLAACEAGPKRAALDEYRPTSADLRPATETETRRILTHPPDGLFEGSIDSGPERFNANGLYQRGGTPSVDGWYSVFGNEVCVALISNGPTTSCRRIMIGPDGPLQNTAADGPSQPNPHVTPLPEDVARRAITGRAVLPPEGSQDRPTEMFGADGSYRSQGRGGLIAGTYDIVGHRVCVQAGSTRNECRYLYRVGRRVMLSSAQRPDQVSWGTMRPLRTTAALERDR